MTEIDSEDYHDFVFKNGRLVGEFEQMYRKSTEVPWRQHLDPQRLDCRVAAELIAERAPYGRVIEVGCGLGYFGNQIALRLDTTNVLGVDVAPSAVEKARALFPELQFEVLDIAGAPDSLPAAKFDLVVIRGCFWYLFPKMDQVVANLAALTAPGGHIFVSQNFPPLDSQFVGKDILPNPQSLMSYFEPHYTMRCMNLLDDRTGEGKNDYWVMFLGQKS